MGGFYTMAKEIRVALLGLGRLGHYHATNVKEKVRGARLVAVVDPFEERANQVAEELGVDKWTKDPQEVFEDPYIDAVNIVTPTSTHGEMIKNAARNGKHIFVEKPLTETLDEADEVIQTIKE